MNGMTLPDDFAFDCMKRYTEGDLEFDVQVQFRGLVFPDNSAPVYRWYFAILLQGETVASGPFHWDPSDRQLTSENVANHLASFYNVHELARRGLSGSLELDNLVVQCKDYMFKEFWLGTGMSSPSDHDYDIIVATLGEEGDFSILLSMSIRPNMMYGFDRKKGSTRIEVSSHVKAFVFTIEQNEL